MITSHDIAVVMLNAPINVLQKMATEIAKTVDTDFGELYLAMLKWAEANDMR